MRARARRRDALVYQIYPRSFADSDGDGIGDLAGIESRLDHIAALGCDAIGLSPINPSPNADFGYDVTDYCAIDPVYGDMGDLDRLVQACHTRDIELLLDIVPCHTSIEHPWFRDHPDRYIRHHGDAPPNNWLSAFGGPAWTPDPLRPGWWYCHVFYPEQPALDWRNPKVVAAMHEAIAFWLDRGVDGFRIDAIQRLFLDAQLRDEPPATAPPLLRSRTPGYDDLDHIHTAHLPEIGGALAELRARFPDAFFVCEAGRPHADLEMYLRSTDLCFSFELLKSPLHAARLREVVRSGSDLPGIAWVLSNHDEPRLVDRWGNPELARVAAMLLLTLPGAAFIYQGDEIGMPGGPGASPPFDRAGRDGYRHPMQWTRDGGFTTGTPWLPMVNAGDCNVSDQSEDPASMLALYHQLIALRRTLDGDITVIDSEGETVAYRRGAHEIWLNFGHDAVDLPQGDVVLATDPSALRGVLDGAAGVVLHRRR